MASSAAEAEMVHARAEVQAAGSKDVALIYAGLETLAAVVMSFLAFDDITTDNATSFTVEYFVLTGCAALCLVVAVRLAWGRHRILGAISLLMLAAAVWGQRAIGPGTVPSWQPECVATSGALVWFLVLSIVLIVLGIRGRS